MLNKMGIGLALMLAMASWQAAATGPVRIHDAWIPEAPPNARLLAGYFDLENAGSAPLIIVEARAEGFGRVEIHRTVTSEGVARMRRQDEVALDPGQTVSFEPGGLHLMFMQFDSPPVSGQEVKVELVDVEGRAWPFIAEVRPHGKQ